MYYFIYMAKVSFVVKVIVPRKHTTGGFELETDVRVNEC
jgi:hypothetical protein